MYSIFDIFKIGIGPSSSHTVGPMKAAKKFVQYIELESMLNSVTKIDIKLYGSLSFTGKGHNIDIGLVLGLSGYSPENISNEALNKANKILNNKELDIGSKSQKIEFDPNKNLIFNNNQKIVSQSNKMKFSAYNSINEIICEKIFISIGGGFIIEEGQESIENAYQFPYNFSSCDELLDMCKENKIRIDQLVLENEESITSEKMVYKRIQNIWNVMNKCIKNGLKNEGVLSGGLNLKRRAPQIYKELKSRNKKDTLSVIDWVNLYAMAVNEENAAGGQVVTAPTNGAAGIIPAVIKYYLEFINSSNKGLRKFILTSGGIGILYKKNASISGAEVGCQGEVGVACSMAAGGLVSALGGTNKEIENAAEIAMEHNLGLTCDPIKGLVQIPCIERNAMGAVKAINAARIAMVGKGEHKVSLDDVIKTMMQTGKDMQTIYKETSKGGLAVNVTEC